VAGHVFAGLPADAALTHETVGVPRNVSALTAACLLVRRAVFEEVGGFDERLAVAFNDVDLCLKIRARGYRLVCTPFATLLHHESQSRARGVDAAEVRLMLDRWGPELLTDPYQSPNLSLANLDGRLRFRAERARVAEELRARLARRASATRAAPTRTRPTRAAPRRGGAS